MKIEIRIKDWSVLKFEVDNESMRKLGDGEWGRIRFVYNWNWEDGQGR